MIITRKISHKSMRGMRTLIASSNINLKIEGRSPDKDPGLYPVGSATTLGLLGPTLRIYANRLVGRSSCYSCPTTFASLAWFTSTGIGTGDRRGGHQLYPLPSPPGGKGLPHWT